MGTKSQLHVKVSSPPDREYLVAEVFLGDEQLAEVNRESGPFSAELYPRRDGQPWKVPLGDLLDALSEVQDRHLLLAKPNGSI